jgi:hypothetical protein
VANSFISHFYTKHWTLIPHCPWHLAYLEGGYFQHWRLL